MTRPRRLHLTVILAAAVAAVSCATMKKVMPGGGPSVKLTAAGDLNIKSDGTALGVVHVRAYLLKDPAGFRTLSYDDLWGRRALDQDPAVLDMKEDVVTSGGDLKLSLKPKPGEAATSIAVLAGYAQPESDAGWRQVVDLTGGKDGVEIVLGPRGMRPAVLK